MEDSNQLKHIIKILKCFVNYLILLFKNYIFAICFVFDILGIIVQLFNIINIPGWILTLILIIGIVVANFCIYLTYVKDSISFEYFFNDDLTKLNSTVVSVYDNNLNIQLNYTSIISNNNDTTCKIKDIDINKFTLVPSITGLDITMGNIQVLDFNNNRLKYPLLLKPKESLTIKLIINLSLSAKNKEKYLSSFNLLSNINFEICINSIENNSIKTNKHLIILTKDLLNKYYLENENLLISKENLNLKCTLINRDLCLKETIPFENLVVKNLPEISKFKLPELKNRSDN